MVNQKISSYNNKFQTLQQIKSFGDSPKKLNPPIKDLKKNQSIIFVPHSTAPRSKLWHIRKLPPPEFILENNKFCWTPSNVAPSRNISLQKVYKLFRGEG